MLNKNKAIKKIKNKKTRLTQNNKAKHTKTRKGEREKVTESLGAIFLSYLEEHFRLANP